MLISVNTIFELYSYLNCFLPPRLVLISPKKTQTPLFSCQWLSRADYHIHHPHQMYLYLLVRIQLVITELQMELPEQQKESTHPCQEQLEPQWRGGWDDLSLQSLYPFGLRQVSKRSKSCYLTCVLVSGLSADSREIRLFRVFFQGDINFTSN